MKKAALLVLIVGTFVRAACAAEDLVTSQLVDQARHWQHKDRDDLAAEIWRSLLRADPEHGEALVKLGLIEARANNRLDAQILLEHANRIRPKPSGLVELTSALASDSAGRKNVLLPPVKPMPSKTEKRSKTGIPVNQTTKKTDQSADPEALVLKP